MTFLLAGDECWRDCVNRAIEEELSTALPANYQVSCRNKLQDCLTCSAIPPKSLQEAPASALG